MLRKLKKYENKVLKYNYFHNQTSQSKIQGSYTAANQNCMVELPNKFITITEDSNLLIMGDNPKARDFNEIAFTGFTDEKKRSPLMAALASVVNSDDKYETNSVKRLVYPHKYNQPCISESNVYLVKLILNGMRRCFPVDGIVNQSVFYTKQKEVYPFLIKKALSQIYSLEELASVEPNLIVYRLVGWIPETLNYVEIGDAKSSFEKLLKNLQSFAIIINFDFKDQVLPLLDLIYNSKTKKRTLVTLDMKRKNPSSVINTEVFGNF